MWNVCKKKVIAEGQSCFTKLFFSSVFSERWTCSLRYETCCCLEFHQIKRLINEKRGMLLESLCVGERLDVVPGDMARGGVVVAMVAAADGEGLIQP